MQAVQKGRSIVMNWASHVVRDFLHREEMQHEAKVVSVERYIERAKIPDALPTHIPVESFWLNQLARHIQGLLRAYDQQGMIGDSDLREYLERISEAFEKLADEYNVGDKWMLAQEPVDWSHV